MNPAHLPSNVVPCRPAHLVYLAEEMRQDEREQFLAITGLERYCPDAMANYLINAATRSAGFAFTVLRANNLPAAAGGLEPVSTGVWQTWMAGTDAGWIEQWRSITKTTRWAMDRVLETSGHRIQTNGLASRTRAIEWYERSLGLRPEGIWRCFGANGEDVACFSRLRGE